MDFPKSSDLARIAADAMLMNQQALSVNAVERPGSDANLLINAIAAMGEEIVAWAVLMFSGAFFGSATGQRLQRVGVDRTGLLPKEAAPARTVVQFATSAPNPTAFTIPQSTQLTVSTGQQFVLLQSTTFPAGSTGPIAIYAQSTIAGKNQQIGAGPMSIVTPIPGAPADLVASSPAASAGADDAETPDRYRARLRAFFRTFEKGTRAALEEAAKGVPGVTDARSIAVLDTYGRAQQMIEVSITDRFTAGLVQQGANPPAYQAQSQALAASVWQALQDTVAEGAYLRVQVAKVTMLPVTLQLRFRSDADFAFTTLVARAVIQQYINTLRGGDAFVYADAIAKLRTVRGLAIQGDEIALPPGDVVVGSALEVLRTDLSLVQASVQTVADFAQFNLPNAIPIVAFGHESIPPPVVTP